MLRGTTAEALPISERAMGVGTTESENAMSDRPDERLLLDAGHGDQRAFGVLVERHHRAIIQFAHRFLGTIGRDVAEDLAQEVFLSAWKSAATFKPRAKVSTWLFRIATNACLNYRRHSHLRRAASLEGDHEAEVSGPADRPADRERANLVRQAVADLPANQRAAIVLRHFHDFSYVEIAEVLETSVSAVESLLFRARRGLRATLTAARDHSSSPQVSPDLGAESL
jgi:RNA polymerase sigma-70 factor (ECF subfamily)